MQAIKEHIERLAKGRLRRGSTGVSWEYAVVGNEEALRVLRDLDGWEVAPDVVLHCYGQWFALMRELPFDGECAQCATDIRYLLVDNAFIGFSGWSLRRPIATVCSKPCMAAWYAEKTLRDWRRNVTQHSRPIDQAIDGVMLSGQDAEAVLSLGKLI